MHPACTGFETYRTRWPDMLGESRARWRSCASCASAGVPLYALTNWSAETFPVARERFDFLGWFEGIVVSGRVIAKPDPAIFRYFLETYHLAVEDILFVDDHSPTSWPLGRWACHPPLPGARTVCAPDLRVGGLLG